jgi:peptidyl-dipeptidase Dcp
MTDASNPLLQRWDAPYGLPPFRRISPEHFEPAFEQAMCEHRTEIEAIAANPEPPGFDNTLAAFDRSGLRLARIEAVFDNLCASATSPALQAVQRRMAAPLAAHRSAVAMHGGLFRRVRALHERRQQLGLTPEQLRLLERVHLDFVRAGAQLEPAAQARYAALMQRLAGLNTAFAQNVLAAEAGYRLVLRGEHDLAGLPAFVRAAAREAAAQRGLAEGHVITLSRSLILPFLAFSERRDLREQAWRAWVARSEGEHDNRALVREILLLRREQAALHGYRTYADYALADRMARSPAAASQLLDAVWARALAALERERAALQALRREAGVDGASEPWDWRYWAEKVRQRDFQLDDAELKPYFSLDRMVEAAFDCAGRLFGVRFTPRADLEGYHPDVKVYEVHAADGAPVGLFLHDNFARPGKRSGAWMSGFNWQSRNADAAGTPVRPIIVNNNNFAKGAAGGPTLLGFDDVRTLFHEFGHGLHGLLSDVTYSQLAGTQVLRDFVELPSQLFEHWAVEPQVLKRHARHWQSGEPIPDALVERLIAARRFGQAYETVRYTASALVDMALHGHPDPAQIDDVSAFEAEVLRERGLPEGTGINHRAVHFQHLFSSDAYAAGYYVYLWAEVLDADGYGAFEEAGDPFDPAVAARLHRCIYAAGNSVDPAEAYAAFRGRPPEVGPLFRKRGLAGPV